MIYFISFFVIAILIQIGMTTESKAVRRTTLVLAVLIPATLAGVRDYNVGTDVSVYGVSLFQAAKASSGLLGFIARYQATIETGYLIVTYLAAQFFSDAHGLFFLLGLLNYSLLLRAIYDYRKEIVPGIAWLTYAFLYFGDSLNIMRQSIAIAIILIGFRFIKERRLAPYVVCVVIAMLFHQSAFIGILLYFAYGILQTRNRWVHYLWIIGAAFVMIFAYNGVIQLLVQVGFLSEKYLRYLSESSYHILIGAMVIRLVPLALLPLFWKQFKKNKDAHYLLLMVILDIILYNAATLSSAVYRACAYMGYYRMFAYSAICKNISMKNNKRIVYVLLITFLVLVFIYEVVINNGNEIYPYTSAILGIRS